MTTTINASWDAVTQKADGTPLTGTVSYQVEYYLGEAPISGTQPPITTTSTSVSIPNVPNGKMGVRVRAIDDQGRLGAWTAYVTGDTSDTPPSVPANFTATFN